MGYDGDLLRLAYKEARVILNLEDNSLLILLARIKRLFFTQDHGISQKIIQIGMVRRRIIKKPDSLMMVPDDIYRSAFDGLMVLSLLKRKLPPPSEEDIKPALVFANTPRTAFDLKDAITSSGV